MAVDTVTTNADSGNGSLRTILASAAAGDTVVFSAAVFNSPAADDIVLNSTLIITKNVSIEGSVNGSDVAVDGNNASTILTVGAAATVSLDNLIIQNGSGIGVSGAQGGPDVPAGNGGDAAGGVLNRGRLTITNSQFTGNTAVGGTGGAGGYYYGAGAGGGAGGNAAGAIYDEPSAHLTIGAHNVFVMNAGVGGTGGQGGQGNYSASGGLTYQATGGGGGYGGANGIGQPGYHGSYDNTSGVAYAFSGQGGPAGKAGYSGDGFAIYNAYQGYGAGGGGGGGTGFNDTGGTSIVLACYARGTRILTVTGEVAVEDLAIGDLLVTAERSAGPIRWIGRRAYAGRFLAGNGRLLPIRICAGALGDGLPRRDLLVSPNHAMLLDGVLIPAEALVNGRSIVQERTVQAVEYFHVELPQHAVIWAEGAASETFRDDDSRGAFHNAREFAQLYPDAVTVPACAPIVTDGYRLEAVRDRIAPALVFAV